MNTIFYFKRFVYNVIKNLNFFIAMYENYVLIEINNQQLNVFALQVALKF